MEETLLDKRVDIMTYITKLNNNKAEPDGAMVILFSALINKTITLVHHRGWWSSDGSTDSHDVVLGYFGHNNYYPTQVGKYISIIFFPLLILCCVTLLSVAQFYYNIFGTIQRNCTEMSLGFVDVSPVTCKLPSFSSWLDSNWAPGEDLHHGMDCFVVDEDLFDIIAQPGLETPPLTPDEFDNIVKNVPSRTTPDDADASAELNSQLSQQNDKSRPKRTVFKSENVDPDDYFCVKCEKSFAKKENYKIHMDCHRGVRHMCPVPVCPKSFSTVVGLNKHLDSKAHTPEEVAPFKKSNVAVPETPKQPPPQVSNNQNQSTPAQIPSKTGPVKQHLVKPKQNIITPTPSSQHQQQQQQRTAKKGALLPIPEPGTETEAFYKSLVVEEGEGKTRSFLCQRCDTHFTRKGDVKRHWHKSCVHNIYRDIQCKICSDQYFSKGKSNLIAHLMKVHKFVGEYVCLKCHSLYTKNEELSAHVAACKKKV